MNTQAGNPMQAMEDSPKLTARQQQILDLVQSAIERTGAPPTRAEIEKHVSFAVDLFLRGCGYQPQAAAKRRARKA